MAALKGQAFHLDHKYKTSVKETPTTNPLTYYAVKLITTVKKLSGAGRQTD
jgi:hypothetical protein